MIASNRRWWRAWLPCALAVLGIGYLGVGLYRLVLSPTYPYACDLKIQWTEQKLVWHGQSPQAAAEQQAAGPGQADGAGTLPDGGEPMAQGCFPPWSSTTRMLSTPPLGWTALRCYAALLDLTAIAFIAVTAYQIGRPLGRDAARLCACSVLPLISHAYCLSLGQLGIEITALLMATLVLAGRGRPLGAGLMLGLALTKPNVAGLFPFIFLIRRQWRVLLAAVGVVVMASGVSWLATRVDPLTSLLQSLRLQQFNVATSHNLLNGLLNPLLGPSRSTAVLAMLGVAICCFLLFARRRDPGLLGSFSTCAVVSMFWAYRKGYDSMLVSFLLVQLATFIPASGRHKPWVVALFWLTGLSLWLPIPMRWHNEWVVQLVEFITWVLGLYLTLLIPVNPGPPAASAEGFLKNLEVSRAAPGGTG